MFRLKTWNNQKEKTVTTYYLQLLALALALLLFAALYTVLRPRTASERDRQLRNIRAELLAASEQIGANASLRRDLQPYLDTYAEGFVSRIADDKIDYETACSRIRERAQYMMRPAGATATAARIGAAVAP